MAPSSKTLKLFIVSAITLLSLAYILYEYSRTEDPIHDDLLSIAELKPSELKINKLEIANIPEAQQEATMAIKDTNLGRAKEVYNKILAAEPKNVEAVYGLGVVYAQEGEDLKASELLHDAFSLDVEKIKTALNDSRLENLKNSPHFQNLLRIHNISIPEMDGQINNPPLQDGKFDKDSPRP